MKARTGDGNNIAGLAGGAGRVVEQTGHPFSCPNVLGRETRRNSVITVMLKFMLREKLQNLELAGDGCVLCYALAETKV